MCIANDVPLLRSYPMNTITELLLTMCSPAGALLITFLGEYPSGDFRGECLIFILF
jgi:hypothetical protein